MKSKVLKILFGLLAMAPLSAGAFWPFDFFGDEDIKVEPRDLETVVENNVSVSASTGGNTATSGNVVTGEAKTSVKVRTEINGEVIENFDEEFLGETEFEQEFEYATGTAEVKTKITATSTMVATIATSTATSTKVLARNFNERISNWFAKLFKNVFSIFKK